MVSIHEDCLEIEFSATDIYQREGSKILAPVRECLTLTFSDSFTIGNNFTLFGESSPITLFYLSNTNSLVLQANGENILISLDNVPSGQSIASYIVESIKDCFSRMDCFCDYDLSCAPNPITPENHDLTISHKCLGAVDKPLDARANFFDENFYFSKRDVGVNGTLKERYRACLKLFEKDKITGELTPIGASDELPPNIDKNTGKAGFRFSIAALYQKITCFTFVESCGEFVLNDHTKEIVVKWSEKWKDTDGLGNPRNRQSKFGESLSFMATAAFNNHVHGKGVTLYCNCDVFGQDFKDQTTFIQPLNNTPEGAVMTICSPYAAAYYVCVEEGARVDYAWCLDYKTSDGASHAVLELGKGSLYHSEVIGFNFCAENYEQLQPYLNDCDNKITEYSLFLKYELSGNPLTFGVQCKKQTPFFNCHCNLIADLLMEVIDMDKPVGSSEVTVNVSMLNLTQAITALGGSNFRFFIEAQNCATSDGRGLTLLNGATQNPTNDPSLSFSFDFEDLDKVCVKSDISFDIECNGVTHRLRFSGEWISNEQWDEADFINKIFASFTLCEDLDFEQGLSDGLIGSVICFSSNAKDYCIDILEWAKADTNQIPYVFTPLDFTGDGTDFTLFIEQNEAATECVIRLTGKTIGGCDVSICRIVNFGGACYGSPSFEIEAIPISPPDECDGLDSPFAITVDILESATTDDVRININLVPLLVYLAFSVGGVSNFYTRHEITYGNGLTALIEQSPNATFNLPFLTSNNYFYSGFVQFELNGHVLRFCYEGYLNIIPNSANTYSVDFTCKDLCSVGITGYSFDFTDTSVGGLTDKIVCYRRFDRLSENQTDEFADWLLYDGSMQIDLSDYPDRFCLLFKQSGILPCLGQRIEERKLICFDCEAVDPCDHDISFTAVAVYDCREGGVITVSGISGHYGTYTVQICDENGTVVQEQTGIAFEFSQDIVFTGLATGNYTVKVLDSLCQKTTPLLLQNNCLAPTALLVGDVDEAAGVVNFSFTPPPITGIVGYVVEYKLQTDPTWATLNPNPTGNAFALSGILCNETYDIRIRTICSDGCFSDWLTTTYMLNCCVACTLDVGNITCDQRGNFDLTITYPTTNVVMQLFLNTPPTSTPIASNTGTSWTLGNLSAGSYILTFTDPNNQNCVTTKEFVIEDLAICPTPTGLDYPERNGIAVLNVNGELCISWDEMIECDAFQIRVCRLSDGDTTIIDLTNDDVPVPITDHFFCIPDLDCQQSYKIEVGCVCGGNCEQTWSNSVIATMPECPPCEDVPDLVATCDEVSGRITIEAEGTTPNLAAGSQILVADYDGSNSQVYTTFDGSAWSVPAPIVPNCVKPEFDVSLDSSGKVLFVVNNAASFSDVKASTDGTTFISTDECLASPSDSDLSVELILEDSGYPNRTVTGAISGGSGNYSFTLSQSPNVVCDANTDLSTLSYASSIVIGNPFSVSFFPFGANSFCKALRLMVTDDDTGCTIVAYAYFNYDSNAFDRIEIGEATDCMDTCYFDVERCGNTCSYKMKGIDEDNYEILKKNEAGVFILVEKVVGGVVQVEDCVKPIIEVSEDGTDFCSTLINGGEFDSVATGSEITSLSISNSLCVDRCAVVEVLNESIAPPDSVVLGMVEGIPTTQSIDIAALTGNGNFAPQALTICDDCTVLYDSATNTAYVLDTSDINNISVLQTHTVTPTNTGAFAVIPTSFTCKDGNKLVYTKNELITAAVLTYLVVVDVATGVEDSVTPIASTTASSAINLTCISSTLLGYSNAGSSLVVDISNPTSPVISPIGANIYDAVSYYEIFNDCYFKVVGGNIEVWDISTPNAPSLLQTISTGLLSINNPIYIDEATNILYVVSSNAGGTTILGIDISSKTATNTLCNLSTNTVLGVMDLCVKDGYLLSGNGDSEFVAAFDLTAAIYHTITKCDDSVTLKVRVRNVSNYTIESIDPDTGTQTVVKSVEAGVVTLDNIPDLCCPIEQDCGICCDVCVIGDFVFDVEQANCQSQMIKKILSFNSCNSCDYSFT